MTVVERREIVRKNPLVTYWLPWPPSVNNLFINRGRGRAPSERYTAWKADAAFALMKQGKRSLSGPVVFRVKVTPPDNRRRDLDNLLKAPLDLCVQHGVIQDDSLIRRIEIEWGNEKDAGAVVEISEAA